MLTVETDEAIVTGDPDISVTGLNHLVRGRYRNRAVLRKTCLDVFGQKILVSVKSAIEKHEKKQGERQFYFIGNSDVYVHLQILQAP
jgi:hypothetical protein